MKEIFSQSVFEKQTNGTVFQREGRLQDFPYAGEGIFESWRYSFDAGKQVFRASNSGKVFEKRIIKDVVGNPQWTTWVEITDAEAHGIQAIAVNDRPLQLPNSDGAIKLQITPQMIGTYTKSEIYSLIEQKVEEENNGGYTYVRWIDGCTTPEEVLNKSYPEGGIIGTFYLVEPHPSTIGKQEKAQYFVWVMRDNNQWGWREIDAPDMRAFVSYPVFDEHAHDSHFHLSGDFERQKWNAASGLLEEVSGKLDTEVSELYIYVDKEISGVFTRIEEEALIAAGYTTEVSGELHEHMADVGDELSLHISPEERAKWNEVSGNVTLLPDDSDRYIVSDKQYIKAFEQIAKGDKTSKLIFNTNAITLKDGNSLVNNIGSYFDDLILGNNLIEGLQLEFTGINTNQTFAWLELDSGLRSPQWSTASGPQIWTFKSGRFERINLHMTDKSKSTLLSNVKLYIYYTPINTVNIGDGRQELALNLVGPKDKEILYNNVPLSRQLMADAEWGGINGDIELQEDLNLKLARLLKTKVNAAGANTHERWDVYRNTVIPSLIQQKDNEIGQEEINYGNKGPMSVEDVLLSGVKNRVRDLLDAQRIPYEFRLEIEVVASQKNPIWFVTDNNLITPSSSVSMGKFEWNWPGPTFELFDEIKLKGHGTESLAGIKLYISWIKYADVVAEAPGYSWTQNAVNYNLNVSGNLTTIVDKNSNTKILENSDTDIAENNTIHIGGNNNVEINGNNGIEIDGDLSTAIGKDDIKTVLGDKGTDVKGNLYLSVGDNLSQEISGILNTTVTGNSVATVAGNNITVIDGYNTLEISEDNELIVQGNNISNIEGNYDASISGSSNIVIAGDLNQTIIGTEHKNVDHIDLKVKGNYNTEVNGFVETNIDGNLRLNVGEVTTFNSKSVSVEAEDTIKAKAQKTIDLSTEPGSNGNIDIITDTINLSADEIKVYNQEIDERYLLSGNLTNREALDIRFDEYNTFVSGEFSTRDEEQQVYRDDVKDQFNIHNSRIQANTTNITEEEKARISGISFEESARISGDLWLSGLIKDLSGHVDNVNNNYDNYYTKPEVDSTLNNYYTKQESNDLLDEKAEVNHGIHVDADEPDIKGLSGILVKVDNKYEWTDNISGILYNTQPPSDVITTEIFKGWENNIYEYELSDVYTIYRFILNENLNIKFTNIKPNKFYTFFFDQKENVRYFAIKNKLFNARELNEFDIGNINLRENSRTVIHVLGIYDNKLDPSGNGAFIVNEVIPQVTSTVMDGNRLFVGNIEGNLHPKGQLSNIKRKAINIKGLKEGDFYSYISNEGVTISSEFMNEAGVTGYRSGWRGQQGNTSDWVVYPRNEPTNILKQGKVGDNQVITIDQFYGDLIIDFRPLPQLVEIGLDFDDMTKLKSPATKGFSTDFNSNYSLYPGKGLYQVYYDEILTEIYMKDSDPEGWFIWRQANSVGESISHSFVWKYKVLDLNLWNTNFEGLALHTITPFVYKRIYNINYVVDNSHENITDVVNLVYFKDPLKFNRVKFNNIPNNADDPISIIDYDKNVIEIVGSTEGINKSIKIRVIDPNATSTHFTIRSASGTETVVVTIGIVHPITTFRIAGELTTFDPQIDHYRIHASPKLGVDYEAIIDWDDNPSDPCKIGKWSIEYIGFDYPFDVLDTSNSSTPDKTLVRPLRNYKEGKAKLRFTSLFNGDFTEVDVRVFIHVAAVEIKSTYTDNKMRTRDEDNLVLRWFDEPQGISIPANSMWETGGNWSVIHNYDKDRVDPLDNATGFIKISNKQVENEPYELEIQFESSDVIFESKALFNVSKKRVVAKIILYIYRGDYLLTFVRDPDDIYSKGISNWIGGSIMQDVSHHKAEVVITPHFAFENGYTLDDDCLNFMKTLPGEDNGRCWVHPGDPSDGAARFKFNMPYRDLEILVKSKKI